MLCNGQSQVLPTLVHSRASIAVLPYHYSQGTMVGAELCDLFKRESNLFSEGFIDFPPGGAVGDSRIVRFVI